MDNNNGNSKYKGEILCYDTPKYVEPNNADKNKLIANVSQFPIGFIKQTKSNEFIIKSDNMIFPGFCIFFGGSLFFIIFIVLFFITKRAQESLETKIFLAIFFGMFICIGLAMILSSKLLTKIILTDNYIQIRKYHVLFCRNSNKIYNYINIKSCHLDIKTSIDQDGDVQKNINVECLDIFNKKKSLFNYSIIGSLEQAEYFVNLLNDFINKNKNMTIIS